MMNLSKKVDELRKQIEQLDFELTMIFIADTDARDRKLKEYFNAVEELNSLIY